MIDFERGAKVTGSKFYFLTGEEALMEWNLINFMLNYHQGNGWNFVIPPYLINKNTGDYCAAISSAECRAVKFLDEKITEQGRDMEVIVPDSQMRALLMPMLFDAL